MASTVPFVVFPTAPILCGVLLVRSRLYGRLQILADRIWAGALGGLIATLVYDAVRPPLVTAFGLTFNPYRAMPFFGSLMTGLETTEPLAIGLGWAYHFWNGISFGMMFALLRPQGGVIAGIVWALFLQGMMMLVYPSFLQVRLSDPGFLLSGIVGHGFWGAVLGYGIKRWGPRA
ncbi:MAG: hypothetical protein U0556_05050 [Dehalococcoidia bacterium]